jgi:threonine dehydratase
MTLEPRQSIDVPQLVREAYERCKDHLSPTPLEHSLYLSKELEAEVWLKLDLMQRTTSFKFRGALNKILSLSQEELDQGIVSASTGNYALAVAEAAKIRGHGATIYVAKDIELSRLERPLGCRERSPEGGNGGREDLRLPLQRSSGGRWAGHLRI